MSPPGANALGRTSLGVSPPVRNSAGRTGRTHAPFPFERKRSRLGSRTGKICGRTAALSESVSTRNGTSAAARGELRWTIPAGLSAATKWLVRPKSRYISQQAVQNERWKPPSNAGHVEILCVQRGSTTLVRFSRSVTFWRRTEIYLFSPPARDIQQKVAVHQR